MIDTSTRLLRPDQLTREVIGQLDGRAAQIVTDAMRVHRLPVGDGLESYRGRHRTSQDEATHRISPVRVAAARLPQRAPGAALRAPVVSRLGVLGRALTALRGAR